MAIIDGKAVAKATREKIKAEVLDIKEEYGKDVGLAVILVGENPASKVYVRNKINACAEVGIKSTFCKLPETATFDEVKEAIEKLNADDTVNGMILQLPLPKGLDEAALLDVIAPTKDADGCHYVQKGKLWVGEKAIVSCTPYGVMKLLEYYDIQLKGKNAVVIGRSNLVGKPLAQLLLNADATVTICHSKTQNLAEITKNADIICVAIGRPKFLTADMVKDGAVVVDVGINSVDGKLCGDCDFEGVKDKCSYITPVPGGVGPMTVTMLLQNTVECFFASNKHALCANKK